MRVFRLALWLIVHRLLRAFARLCKTKTNDDALEVIAAFDDHCGFFATSSSSTYKRICLGYAICYRSAWRNIHELEAYLWHNQKSQQISETFQSSANREQHVFASSCSKFKLSFPAIETSCSEEEAADFRQKLFDFYQSTTSLHRTENNSSADAPVAAGKAVLSDVGLQATYDGIITNDARGESVKLLFRYLDLDGDGEVGSEELYEVRKAM